MLPQQSSRYFRCFAVMAFDRRIVASRLIAGTGYWAKASGDNSRSHSFGLPWAAFAVVASTWNTEPSRLTEKSGAAWLQSSPKPNFLKTA